MKKHIYKLSIILLVIFSSCSEDFLERSPSDQLSSATFFTQEKDLVYAVTGCYAAIGFDSWDWDQGYSTDMLRIESVTDNGYDGHSWNALYEMAIGTSSAYDDYVSYFWMSRYKGVQRVNRVLEGADNVTDISSDLKARLIAEAKFLRAYFYFDLVYLWGDVPYLKNSITPEQSTGLERTSKNTILEDIVKELTEAAKDLPLEYDDANLGRATKGAALALKTRILLYHEKWIDAAKTAQEVMNLGVYSLYPDYGELFSYAAINNQEVIFDLQEMPEKQYNFTLANYGPNSVGGWSSGTPLQSIVDAYDCTDGLSIDDSPLYDPANPYSNRDSRLYHTILYPGHDWHTGVYNTIPGATYPGQEIVLGDVLGDGTEGEWNKTFTGYNWLKYNPIEDFYDGNMWNGSLHLILIRYADVLLMYAEAKIEAGDIDQSVVDAINLVRNRAGMPDITLAPQTEMREIVRKERRVELAFEGLRLLDIRRWKIAENVMPGVPKMLEYTNTQGEKVPIRSLEERYFDSEKDYLWPIPQNEIDISKIEQNPGW